MKPTGQMKLLTKCERVQPWVVGVDAKGEFIWEGRQMPYWQMAMFPVRYVGDFLGHWMKARLAAYGFESDPETPSMDISKEHKYGKRARIDAIRKSTRTGD